MTNAYVPLPRGPVLGARSFSGAGRVNIPAVDAHENRTVVSSGRAAIYLALKQLDLPRGTHVLVPTYHCPTMVAPIVHANLTPLFYAIGNDGLPCLSGIAPFDIGEVGVMIVAHFFGHAQSLESVRNWCDERQVTLIEDCAHTFFGHAGSKPVGAWGDFATASITKFFAVPEAGLLISNSRTGAGSVLQKMPLLAQLKGLARLLQAAFRVRTAPRHFAKQLPARRESSAANQNKSAHNSPAQSVLAQDPLQGCDMSRSEAAAALISSIVLALSHRPSIVEKRRANHELLRQRLRATTGAKVLFDEIARGAPYALPLWVDDADRVYHGLRDRGFPVFRWDFVWHGTPAISGDCGPLWSRHVLQLLCHQDLSTLDIEAMARCAASLIAEPLEAQRAPFSVAQVPQVQQSD
jgi:perosamine synthetase